MAKLVVTMPDEVIKQIQKVNDNYDEIFGGMTEAGADVMMSYIQKGAKYAFGAAAKNPLKALKKTKVYKTPSDGGINTKVAFYGYQPPKKKKDGTSVRVIIKGKYNYTNKGVPWALITAARSSGTVYRYPGGRERSIPFMPQALSHTAQIKKAMLKKQSELTGGLLDD